MLFHSQPGLEYTSFYSCGHLQRGNKQDFMVNEGKGEKKKNKTQMWVHITWDKRVWNLWSTK